MFSENYLIKCSIEDMRLEVENLLAEAVRLKAESEGSLQRAYELRRESVDTRAVDPDLAEMLWIEAERLRIDSKELLRQSTEKRLHASEVKHRLEIRSQIAAIDD